MCTQEIYLELRVILSKKIEIRFASIKKGMR